jgi:hypothetical protein
MISIVGPSIALAQPTSLLTPFVGVWSDSKTGCRLLTQGRLDKMSTAEASRFGVVEISMKGIDWLYNSGTTQCEFKAGEPKMAGHKVLVPAICSYKGEDTPESISLTRTAIKLDLHFANGFWRGGTKIKCH